MSLPLNRACAGSYNRSDSATKLETDKLTLENARRDHEKLNGRSLECYIQSFFNSLTGLNLEMHCW